MSKLSILIVDDESVILDSMKTILSKMDVHVDTASSAHEAIHKIDKEDIFYDAVVCDINMPLMSGIEFSEQFYHQLPIILMTGSLTELQEYRILNICDAFIDKLDSEDRLYPAILKAIERRQPMKLCA